MTNIIRGRLAKLYPTKTQAARLEQWSGALRFVWNRFRDAEAAQYAANQTFLFRADPCLRRGRLCNGCASRSNANTTGSPICRPMPCSPLPPTSIGRCVG